MTLYFDGSTAFFAERTSLPAHALTVALPEGATLFVGGVRLKTAEGRAHLPKALLTMGENVLALAVGERLYPVEPLYFDGETVTPAGLPTEALLLTGHKRALALEKTVEALRLRIEALERAQTAHTLFH